MTNELRSSNRVNPSRTEAIVHGIGTETIPAAVINESFSGLGMAIPVMLKPGHGLSVGMDLLIEYSSVRGTASVRHESFTLRRCPVFLHHGWRDGILISGMGKRNIFNRVSADMRRGQACPIKRSFSGTPQSRRDWHAKDEYSQG